MLERSSLLLNIPKYNKEIQRYTKTCSVELKCWSAVCLYPNLSLSLSLCRVFSSHLLRLCKLHPSLVVDQSHELLEFAGATAKVYSKEEIYTHVVTTCLCSVSA